MQETAKPTAKATAPVLLDLFCGVGGFSLGATRAGFSVAVAVDLDPHAISAHETNFPNSNHLKKDISSLTGDALLDAAGVEQVDGLIGGPPCQGFSFIGHSQPTDPRNQLFAKFFRLVSEVKPRFFLAENVPGILGKRYDPLRAAAFAYVQKDYVLLSPIAIKANEFGAPTTRTRVFFFGYRPNTMSAIQEKDFSPPEDAQVVRVSDALSGLPTHVNPNWRTEDAAWRKVTKVSGGHFEDRLHGHIPEGVGHVPSIDRLKRKSEVSGFWGTVHTQAVLARFEKVPQGSSDKVSRCPRLKSSGFCPTLRAGTAADRGSFQAVRPLHPDENRVITPREAARLQGFPDWFQFSPTRWHSFRQIGNSVSPLLAEQLLARIRKALPQSASAK